MGFPYISGSMIAVNLVALYVPEESLIHSSFHHLCFVMFVSLIFYFLFYYGLVFIEHLCLSFIGSLHGAKYL